MNMVPGTLFFFVTYEWAQQAIVLHYTSLVMVTGGKQSSLKGPFVSYEENEAL
jgi:hypothetical protein